MKNKVMKALIVVVLLVLTIQLTFAATRVFYVEETEFVKISPTAIDPDKDQITYEYSAPLDNEGEWQTGYDDAGEYQITITASDGEETTEEVVTLIVENKNQAPDVTEKSFSVKETQTIDLKEFISDPDDDTLRYKFNQPFNKQGVWQTTFDDAGDYTTTFSVSDSEFTTEGIIEISIEETNQPPVITKIFSEEAEVNAKEGETLAISAEAIDNDGDEITFLWKINNQIVSEEKEFNYDFNFSSVGEYVLTLTISDGERDFIEEWTINVENTNRKPQISHDPIIVKEGEEVKLLFPEIDRDGDKLNYTFEEPLDETGKWQTTFEDAGTYSLKVTADDNNLKDKTEVLITVLDVDRVPEVILPKNLEINEGETLIWTINTSDPDGDKLEAKINNPPEGALFNDKTKTFTWQPSFDEVKRRGGMISNILNSLRLERYLLKKKTISIEVEVCGRELCSVGNLPIIVYNVNRAPALDYIENVTINETESVAFSPTAQDPDGDIVSYKFSKPLKKYDGTWSTDFENEGTHVVYITATDGSLQDTKQVGVNVQKTNRAPSLDIRDDDLTVNEGQQFSFKVSATDPDNDNLTIILRNGPEGAHFSEGLFLWEPDYDFVNNKSESGWDNIVSGSGYLNKKFNSEQRVQWLEFAATDDDTEVIHPVKVTVKNRNQKPEIIDYTPTLKIVEAKINQPVIFQVVAKDKDNDLLKYSWSFGVKDPKVKGTNTIERIFKAPGEKQVSVTVSDGRDEVRKVWKVQVSNEILKTQQQPVHLEEAEILVYEIIH